MNEWACGRWGPQDSRWHRAGAGFRAMKVGVSGPCSVLDTTAWEAPWSSGWQRATPRNTPGLGSLRGEAVRVISRAAAPVTRRCFLCAGHRSTRSSSCDPQHTPPQEGGTVLSQITGEQTEAQRV